VLMRYVNMLLCLVAVLQLSCNTHPKNELHNTVYRITKPLVTDTTIYSEFVSSISSIRHIEIRALEKGYLHQIYIDEGQKVQKGQLLFQIRTSVYQAEVEKAAAEQALAQLEYANTKLLHDSLVVSKNELAMSKAKFDKAKAEYALAKTHLEFTQIRAPFDGYIGRLQDVRLGSLIEEGALITTLSDNSDMWVYFNVPETLYLDWAMQAETNAHKTVALKLANGKIFNHEGFIETVQADFNIETGNIAFRATFPNHEGLLRNGETGIILLPVELKSALIIPQKCVFEILDKKYVYVVDNDGLLQSREITTSAEIPHFYIVSTGLTSQDHILVDGINCVHDKQKIQFKITPIQNIAQELAGLKAE
jgi:membrane fusion protein (multidrug efflux system)